MLDPKFKVSKVFIINNHLRESKAFWKSNEIKIPGIFCDFVCSMMPMINLIFWLIYLPFVKPVSSVCIRFGSSGSIRFAMTLAASLQSTLSSVIGRQFDILIASHPFLE